MRRFHSYGPVDCRYHFCVRREELTEKCFQQLIGISDEGGHYFTIWAPRQTGKTWLMRQVMQKIGNSYPDRFLIGTMSVQGVVMEEDAPDEVLFRQFPRIFRDTFGIEPEVPKNWGEWADWFSAEKGLFEKPLILFIDEFDSLPRKVIDRLVTLFRDMYLKRKNYLLHGLALIGVRAVLGVESLRGSPFNVQRSLHVPNFTSEEVEDLFAQYQEESAQKIMPEVIRSVYDCTRGQPGLVCWFGELLTETFNPGKEKIIDIPVWEYVYMRACTTEWNNTLLNLIGKAKTYYPRILELFSRSDIPFSFRSEWCSYLYLNGIIDSEDYANPAGKITRVCRFSSPFVRQNLYDALSDDLVGDRTPMLALDPLDDLADVFDPPDLNVPALIRRYKEYLGRLKVRGLNPWKDQPRRADLHLTEYAGHFHLYAWLHNALGRQCAVSPEFPAGSGRIYLHLKCGEKRGIIEVKSFTSAADLKDSKIQSARYAIEIGLDRVTLVVFVPVEDEETLKKLSGRQEIEGITVTTEAVGWA